MKSIIATFASSFVILIAAATWQDVVIAAIGGIVALSGVYQIVTLARLARMKADIEVIHKTTNSLSEKLLEGAKATAAADATLAERDRVAAIDDKVALAVKDAAPKDADTAQTSSGIAKNVEIVKEDVSVVKDDVKDVQKKVTKDITTGINAVASSIKKAVDRVTTRKKKRP